MCPAQPQCRHRLPPPGGHLPLGSRLPSEPYGSSASGMPARWCLPLLLAGIRDAFFRSVSRSPCLVDLKTRVPKLARGTDACLPEDSGSDSPTSAQLMRGVRPVSFVVLPRLVVLVEVVRFAAAADDSGWWPSELCPSSLQADRSSEPSGGGLRLSRGANLISLEGGVLSSVSFLRCQQKSRSIGSVGGFKDNHMWTSQLFVIRIISASGGRSSGSSCSRDVPCLVVPISIRNPTPGAMVLSMPASRCRKVGSVSSIQSKCPRLCHWILSTPTGSGLLGRTTDGSSMQRRTDRGPARHAGALLAYMVHLYCGRLGITYDHFWRGWGPQPEQRQRVLSTWLLRYPDVFLLYPLAKGRGIR